MMPLSPADMEKPTAREDAKAYYDWFILTERERVDAMLKSIDATLDMPIEEILQRYSKLIALPENWNGNAKTPICWSRCVDFGTLLGRKLIDEHSDLYWNFNEPKELTDSQLWRPVVAGFKSGDVLRPDSLPSLFAEALRRQDFTRTLRAYRNWESDTK